MHNRSRGLIFAFGVFYYGSARNPKDPLRTFGLDTHVTQQANGEVVQSRVGEAECFGVRRLQS